MDWPPRILHVIDRLDGYGAARMLRHLASRQAAAGARVTVAALAADNRILPSLQRVGVGTRQFSSRGGLDGLALTRLAWMAARADVDVIHSWQWRVLSVAARVRRSDRTALVATLGPPRRRRPWMTALKRLFRRVDGVAAVDEATQAWLCELSIDRNAATIVRRGVDAPPPTAIDRATLLAELSIPSNVPLIAVASPLVRQKALDESIWAFELVRVLYPEGRLLIAGDGPDRHRLERFALQVSEPGYVRFLGYRNDLPDLLRHVDVYWQLGASTTTPWALLEALAAATPVVAADMPAHRVVMGAGQSEWLTPLGGRAEIARVTDQILRDPNSARQVARDASAAVLVNWSLEAAINAYRDLYGRSIRSSAARR
jgi:glycosyltransferase involved in cell wall biosynthesis